MVFVDRNKILKKLGIPDKTLDDIITFHEGMKGFVVSEVDFSDYLML